MVKKGMSVRIGLELLTAYPFSWRTLRGAARSVEDVGFDSLWVPDHMEKEFGGQTMAFYDAMTMLGGLADVTSRVALGASVHNGALRHPFRLAHAAVTVDEISDGRAVLGVGAGGRGYEYRYLDADTEFGYSRLAESVEIVARLLTGNEVSFRGRFWSCDQARLSTAAERTIPLMIGAASPKTIDLAFRWGDEWNTVELSNPTVEHLAGRVAVADDAAARHQRPVRRSLDVMVAPTLLARSSLPDSAISGEPGQIADALLAFGALGFDEVHCYGPAPSQEGGDGWATIIRHLHARA